MLGKRMASAVPTLFGLSLLAFGLVRLVPGDTATALLGLEYDEPTAAALRSRWGLDRSLFEQYWLWISHVFRGDLGTSNLTGQPVWQAIAERIPVTLELASLSLVVAVVLGVPLGALAASQRGKILDRVAGLVGLTGISLPSFWLGTLLVLVFTLGLHVLPSGGHVSLSENASENLRHMLLPSAALGLAVGAVVARMTRSSMLEISEQDWVRAARAKGLGRFRVSLRHVLRPALVPVVTALGVQAGYLLAGSVVIEEVFSLPGLGRLALEALGNRDYPLLQGTLLVFGALFLLSSLVVDLLTVALDPRLRQ